MEEVEDEEDEEQGEGGGGKRRDTKEDPSGRREGVGRGAISLYPLPHVTMQRRNLKW